MGVGCRGWGGGWALPWSSLASRRADVPRTSSRWGPVLVLAWVGASPTHTHAHTHVHKHAHTNIRIHTHTHTHEEPTAWSVSSRWPSADRLRGRPELPGLPQEELAVVWLEERAGPAERRAGMFQVWRVWPRKAWRWKDESPRVGPPARRGKSPGHPDEGSPVTQGKSPPVQPEGRAPGAVFCGMVSPDR